MASLCDNEPRDEAPTWVMIDAACTQTWVLIDADEAGDTLAPQPSPPPCATARSAR